MFGDIINTTASIEYGLLIAIALVAILMFCISALNKVRSFTILSYIVAVVLVIPLTFQMSRLIGACYVSSTAEEINNVIGTISPEIGRLISSTTDHSIGWFLFRRVLWSLIFMGAGAFGIYKTMTYTSRPRASSKYTENVTRRRRENRISRRR